MFARDVCNQPWSRRLPPSLSDEYANLEIVDIQSLIQTTTFDSRVRRDTISRAFGALKSCGFVILTGHGIDEYTLQRQFDIGGTSIDGVDEGEKHRLRANPMESGSFAGYKV